MRSQITAIISLLLLSQSAAIAQDESRSARRPDMSKAFVEMPLKRIISTTKVDTPARPSKTKTGKVAPGLVAWHGSFEAAQVASAASGKPILLFQMMGNLDEEFC